MMVQGLAAPVCRQGEDMTHAKYNFQANACNCMEGMYGNLQSGLFAVSPPAHQNAWKLDKNISDRVVRSELVLLCVGLASTGHQNT